jgi:hypothetical protein
MSDNWTKLKWRLQSVANNEANGGCSGFAFVTVKIYLSNGLPIMWGKPQREPLEPKAIDISHIPHTPQPDWDCLMRSLVNGQRDGMIRRTLLVRDGKPLGLLNQEIA